MNSISESVGAVKDKIIGSATQATQSGTEPASGAQGAGTVDEPYDHGNKPETSTSTETATEPPSGQTGLGTKDQPYDQGNQPEQSEQNLAQSTNTAAAESSPPSSQQPTKKKGQGIPITLDQKLIDPDEEERGRNMAAQAATASGASTEKWPVSDAGKAIERDISPGTLPDGSHARTSGDKGESYTPGKMSMLKGKLLGR